MSDLSQYLPWQNEREEYLFANMRRWRRVAEREHAAHCERRGDCSKHVEDVYNTIKQEDET